MDLNCLLNCLRVSLLGFSSFFTLSEGCPFCKEVVQTVPNSVCRC